MHSAERKDQHMFIDLKTKYLGLPASMPWPSIPGTRFPWSHMCDIDRDGRDEVVAYSPFSGGRLTGALGLMSYFEYGAIAPEWQGSPQPQQLLATSVIPGAATPASQLCQGCFRQKGCSELLTLDGNQILSLMRWFDTNEIPGQLAGLVPYWQTAGYVYNGSGQEGAPNWPLASTDSFYIGDVDGDGLDEIVAWDGGANLALLKWNGTDIRLTWISSGGVIPGATGQWPWTLGASNRFYVGDITHYTTIGNGRADIMVYDGASLLALLRWQPDTGFELFWETDGTIYSDTGGQNWGLSANDWFHIADIDGDGRNEIIAFVGYSMSGSLAGIRWNGTDLRVLGMNANGAISQSQNPENVGWVLTDSQINYVADVEKSGQAVIVAFQPVSTENGMAGIVGLLRWTGPSTAFEVDFAANQGGGCMLTNPDTGLAWSIGADNIFTCADVDGDGIAEVVIQSDSGSGVALVKWNGAALIPLWSYFTSESESSVPLPGWGMNVIAAAPATAFTLPPDGTPQYEIFQQASNSLTSGSTNIYSQFPLITESGPIDSWAAETSAAIADLGFSQPQYYWPWMKDYANQIPVMLDVLTQIETALTGVQQAYGFLDDMKGVGGLLASVANQQDMDLGTVQDNMIVLPPDSSTGNYWFGQILDAVLWGAAAAPVGPGGQVVLAVAASLFGSLLASPSISPQGPMSYETLKTTIVDQNYSEASAAAEQVYQTLSTDPVKLGLLVPLLENVWPWTATTASTLAAATSNFNRIYFYQYLMPQVFVILQWFDSPLNVPWRWDDYIPLKRDPISVPCGAWWSFEAEDGNYNVFVLAQQGSTVDNLSFPQQVLTDDIFGTLAVSAASFVNGADGWSLPTASAY
jgi:hypothetical protein